MSSDAQRTVLIVDDDPHVIRGLSARFAAAGWRVMSERDVAWAEPAVSRRSVDVVVLDAGLPGLAAIGLGDKLRAARPQIVLILIDEGKLSRSAVAAMSPTALVAGPATDDLRGDDIVAIAHRHAAQTPHDPPTIEPRTLPADLVDERAVDDAREVEAATAAAGQGELRGNLRRTSFPRLLARLHREGRSGGLFLLRDRVKKIVYFRKGHPTFIKSNVLDECLGRVLVRERMISEAECAESVRRMKAERRQQGSILIEQGVISPHNLRFGLELQLQVKLFEIFDWSEGEFVFRGDVGEPVEAVGLDTPAAQIILDGIRRAYHHDRLAGQLANLLDTRPVLTNDPDRRFVELELSPAEHAFLALCDGSKSLQGLLVAPPIGLDMHGAMTLVLALEAVGTLELPDTDLVAASQPRPRLVSSAFAPEEAKTIPDAATSGPATVLPPGPLTDGVMAHFVEDRRGKPPGDVLGVRPGAPLSEVDAAYTRLAKELHPDRFRDRPESSRALARVAFDLASSAYRTLAMGDSRPPSSPHAVGLPAAEDTPVPGTLASNPAHTALSAEQQFRRGEVQLAAGDLAGAIGRFRRACELRPDMGLYVAYLAWAELKQAGMGGLAAEVALPGLQRACRLSPLLEAPHLFLGRCYVAMSRDDLAEPELERALQSNPDSAEALAELRALYARRRAARR
jgi:CheY-like chemotaxis protein